ncbi:hypothetical protein BDR03DRAFT_120608 [Suillus americanus]|nr:hypothetical protein BDR03DRAFT_120608 [Suillus americanus]
MALAYPISTTRLFKTFYVFTTTEGRRTDLLIELWALFSCVFGMIFDRRNGTHENLIQFKSPGHLSTSLPYEMKGRFTFRQLFLPHYTLNTEAPPHARRKR